MNKTILVTGTSGELGYKISKTLLENGYSVIGLSRNETNNVLQLKEIREYTHIEFDLSYPERIKELILDLQKKKVVMYGLVNNAAFAYDDIITNANIEKLRYSYDINVVSPIILTKYVIRNMLLNNINGSIVHISSISTKTGYKGLSMYASSKGALEAFSKNAAREWGETGIRSNVVIPGFMETNMSKTLTKDQKDRIYKRTSLKEPTDISSVAETVAFLISDKSKSITGQNINVDNGTI
jgi:3-oxoacyl-[acyl-carrier protein] reductase